MLFLSVYLQYTKNGLVASVTAFKNKQFSQLVDFNLTVLSKIIWNFC